jgi:thiamine pyrophosphate-dependent acetolactate synthase large subunit-like protein
MNNPNALLHRRDVVNELVRDRGDLLVIAGLGAPNWDVSAAGDHPNNFPLWGAMGAASMIGLGLALAQPKRKVLVITGDGEMLMNIGSLASIAVEAPKNLTIAVLDNERFGETGMQKPSPLSASTSPPSQPPAASAVAHCPHDGGSHRTPRPRP